MNEFFKLNEYIIKQKVQPFKSAKTIIIINPDTSEEIGSIKKVILEAGGFFKGSRDALSYHGQFQSERMVEHSDPVRY